MAMTQKYKENVHEQQAQVEKGVGVGVPDLVPDPVLVTDPGGSAEPGMVPIARSGSCPAHPTDIATTPCGMSVIAA